jgi:hypothetical protein
MGSADLPVAEATRQQISYTVLQGCTVFVFQHANLRTMGIRKAARGVHVLPLAAKQIRHARSSVTDDIYAAK